jgi:hypothetical protein
LEDERTHCKHHCVEHCDFEIRMAEHALVIAKADKGGFASDKRSGSIALEAHHNIVQNRVYIEKEHENGSRQHEQVAGKLIAALPGDSPMIRGAAAVAAAPSTIGPFDGLFR